MSIEVEMTAEERLAYEQRVLPWHAWLVGYFEERGIGWSWTREEREEHWPRMVAEAKRYGLVLGEDGSVRVDEEAG